MFSADDICEIAAIENVRDRFQRVLRGLAPGDVVIDCGANVGDVSAKFLTRGCVVHAFEPDPVAAAALIKRFGGDARIAVHQAAVGVADGAARLYFHRNRAEVGSVIELTQSSSLVADKRNVSSADHVEVDVIDLGRFIASAPGRIAVLKIDVEGAEADLLEMLLERGLCARFDVAFVETHEVKVPSTRPGMARVRAALERQGLRHIFLDWT